MDSAYLSLAAIFAAVVLAPPLSHLSKRFVTVPLPVCEIALGMLVGPAILGIAEPGDVTRTMGRMGLAAIIFIAGYELDYKNITRKQLGWATSGWLLSLVLAVLAGIGAVFLANAGGLDTQGDGTQTLVVTGAFVGIALTSTALSTAMPSLRDAGELGTPFGRAIIAAGTVGQLAPLLAISVVFGGRDIWWSAIALVLFSGLVFLSLLIARSGLPAWARRLITYTMHTSGAFGVRLVVFSVALFTALSVDVFQLDMLVGAFAAGTLMRQLMNNVASADRELTERKVQGVAFGLLTPMFFVTTGIAFDLRGLFAQPLALALIPAFIVIMIVARGLPGSFVLPWRSPARDRMAAMLWTSVGLAVIVAIVNIAQEQGALSSVLGSAMVGAGMVSMLTFPTGALAIRPKPKDEVEVEAHLPA